MSNMVLFHCDVKLMVAKIYAGKMGFALNMVLFVLSFHVKLVVVKKK